MRNCRVPRTRRSQLTSDLQIRHYFFFSSQLQVIQLDLGHTFKYVVHGMDGLDLGQWIELRLRNRVCRFALHCLAGSWICSSPLKTVQECSQQCSRLQNVAKISMNMTLSSAACWALYCAAARCTALAAAIVPGSHVMNHMVYSHVTSAWPGIGQTSSLACPIIGETTSMHALSAADGCTLHRLSLIFYNQ